MLLFNNHTSNQREHVTKIIRNYSIITIIYWIPFGFFLKYLSVSNVSSFSLVGLDGLDGMNGRIRWLRKPRRKDADSFNEN